MVNGGLAAMPLWRVASGEWRVASGEWRGKEAEILGDGF